MEIAELVREQLRKEGYQAAIDRWIDDAMWDRSSNRPPDLQAAFVFARAFREGFNVGCRITSAYYPTCPVRLAGHVATDIVGSHFARPRTAAASERLAQIAQFRELCELLEAGDVDTTLEWLRAAIKLLEKQTG